MRMWAASRLGVGSIGGTDQVQDGPHAWPIQTFRSLLAPLATPATKQAKTLGPESREHLLI